MVRIHEDLENDITKHLHENKNTLKDLHKILITLQVTLIMSMKQVLFICYADQLIYTHTVRSEEWRLHS
jgi:hypothetical protein